ncbi:MAG: carboxy terminal-processing peptidase [Bacteroidia bacterium]
MRKILFAITLSVIVFSHTAFANDSTKVVLKNFEPESQHPVLYQLVGQILNSYHLRKLNIDDKLSSNLLDAYLENLDPGKMYFLQQDIEQFEQFRNKLDDDLMMGNVQKAFDMYNLYQKRLEERIQFTKDLLKSDFDLSTKDSLLTNREKAKWAANFKDYDLLWKRKIKLEFLQLKAGGKDAKICANDLIKRYDNLLKQLSKTKNEDVFSFFANSLTEIADPHTNYFSPRMAEDFNTSMSLSLEGIGATLQTENEYTKIREVVKGGPADRSKMLHANDKIVAVGQGKDGEMVSILDWRIDDVVALIRGKKGTIVRLEIIPSDATNSKTKIVEITRDKIVLEDQSAKGSIKEAELNGKKIKVGVISIPTFYLDFAGMQRKDPNYKSTTKDVKRLINELKKDSAQAFIIDLRNNGGGSLQEAVELTGLFIKKGPVVQVKDAYGVASSEEDRDDQIFWDGPLMVMVNRFSASASEIFAAAIQDYHRGIIVGEKTFGKGTVQNMLDLNQFMMMDGKKLGQVKITIAKFYRISGGSTQHKGVIPDIEFPSIYAAKEYGEEASKYALPYDEIAAVSYKALPDNKTTIESLKKSHLERMKSEPEYAYLLEDIKLFNEAKEKAYTTLNEVSFKAEMDAEDVRKKKRDEERKKIKETSKVEPNLILDESLKILLESMNK